MGPLSKVMTETGLEHHPGQAQNFCQEHMQSLTSIVNEFQSVWNILKFWMIFIVF